jgi:hypothetical protein
MHQFSTKNLAKSEFMMGLAFAIAKTTNIDQHLHVQGMLAELIQYTEFCRACLRASEADAGQSPSGVMTPAAMPLWTVRMMYPKMFVRMCEIIQTLGAGGLVAVPSYAELDGPAAADVTTYFQAANADAKTRIKLFRPSTLRFRPFPAANSFTSVIIRATRCGSPGPFTGYTTRTPTSTASSACSTSSRWCGAGRHSILPGEPSALWLKRFNKLQCVCELAHTRNRPQRLPCFVSGSTA